MPATRRAAVARVAARRGLWLIEDDPYGELRLEGKDLPWLVQYPGAEDRTVLLGSFSKVIAPGVRLGWLRATATLRMACARVKQATDVHSSTIDQAAVARYLSVTDLEAHLRRLRAAYRARRDALLAGLTAHLPEGTHWNRPEGGMFVWAGFPAGYDAARLLPQAMRHGVAYVPGIPFHVGAADPSLLRLSFAAHSPEQIKEGIRRLALAVARGPGRH
jgi:2-aminoadipate transaminase